MTTAPRTKRAVLLAALSLATSLAGLQARAQNYPDKPVTMIIPFAAGGPTDTVGRIFAQSMTAYLRQQVVVENVGGAGGTLGAARAARSEPNGYTILLHHIGQATAPALYRKLSYSATDDFSPIGLVADVPMTLVARKDFPPRDLKELVSYVQTHKDKVTYANAGVGSASHLCGMLLMSAIKADLTTVPYKGTGPAMNDLLGGQVDFMCDQTTNTSGQIRAGKIKAYAVTTKAKVASLPNLPTADSSGLPGFEIAVWHAMYAPRNTPRPVMDKLAAALQHAVKDPIVRQKLADLGTEPVPAARATPAALDQFLRGEIVKWMRVIKAAGVYAD